MPFDLFVRPLSGGERIQAGALEAVELPSGSTVKSIDAVDGRDRYAIVSGEELIAMCRRRLSADPGLETRLAAVSGGSIGASRPYLLHWEGWESGLS